MVKGMVIMIIIYAFAFIFKLETLLWVFNKLGTVFIVGIIIIFQPEIRNFFLKAGQIDFSGRRKRSKATEIDSILNAAEILSTMRRGCIIVFIRNTGFKSIIETGTLLNADISSALILTVFGKDTPLHDGAMLISGKKIIASGCFLPLSEQSDIKQSFGTRHRAALGTAESTDAVVLVVSEETGAMSLAYNSNIYYDLKSDEIKNRLEQLVVLGNKELLREEEAGV